MIYDLPVDTNEIAALLRPFAELEAKQLDQTLIYVNLLRQWNERVNLSAVRGAKDIVKRHFGESFFAATQLLSSGPAQTVIDLGSGAGFPGLPLAMIAPQAQVTLIESQGKKAAFLNEVIRALGLGNVTVFKERAENYPGTAQSVIMRAVEKFPQAAAVALKLAAQGGRLALMIGASQVEEAVGLSRDVLWQQPISIPGGHSRVLLIGNKAAAD